MKLIALFPAIKYWLSGLHALDVIFTTTGHSIGNCEISNVVDHLPAAGSRSIMKLPPGRRVRVRVVVGLGLGLRLVIAVRWWGAGEGSG